MQERQRRRVSDPLYRLPVGHDPNIIHGNDGIQERDETFLMVRLSEPCGVIKESERSPIKPNHRKYFISNQRSYRKLK